ncbi:MAG TPA: hypothetical protein VM619_09070 [Luteimonas sp.]|nr:hypothetical protein [Luteimonas sp.]
MKFKEATKIIDSITSLVRRRIRAKPARNTLVSPAKAIALHAHIPDADRILAHHAPPRRRAPTAGYTRGSYLSRHRRSGSPQPMFRVV